MYPNNPYPQTPYPQTPASPTPAKAPDPCKVTTGEARLSYCHLLKAYKNPNQQNAEEKYSVTVLIPKSDFATKQRIDMAIEAAKAEATPKTWGGVAPPPSYLPIPIHDGDALKQNGTAFGPECRGHWVMTVGTKMKPGVVDMNCSPIIDETQVYSGMHGRVSMRFFGYNTSGKKGIGAGLNNVQKTHDGEPLTNYSTPDEDFGPGPGAPAAAPSYPQQYPQPQQYQQAPAPQYQQPQQYQPAPQGYPQPNGQYQQPMQYQPMQQQGGYAPNPAPMQYQPMQQQINPINGQPMVGPLLGLGANPQNPH
jgi:hypothetical protein